MNQPKTKKLQQKKSLFERNPRKTLFLTTAFLILLPEAHVGEQAVLVTLQRGKHQVGHQAG